MRDPNSDPKNDLPQRKPAPQWRNQQRLADRRPGKKRGRRAKSSGTDDDAAPREPPPIPINQRLAFRPAEFAALIGISYLTIWRAIKRGDIEVVVQNGIKVIPRSYAVKAGYITDAS